MQGLLATLPPQHLEQKSLNQLLHGVHSAHACVLPANGGPAVEPQGPAGDGCSKYVCLCCSANALHALLAFLTRSAVQSR